MAFNVFSLSSYLPARKHSAFKIESASGNSAYFCSYLSQLSFLKLWSLSREKSIETLPLHRPRKHAHFVPISTLQSIDFVTRKHGGI